MGDRNADRRGRLEGSEAEEMRLIPEAVTPDGLIARAGIMRGQGDESCARHLELAAEEITRLWLERAASRQSAKNPLENPELQAASYSTATLDDEKKLRLTLYKNPHQQDPLGYMILVCEEIYDMSSHLMKNYDKLEGIK